MGSVLSIDYGLKRIGLALSDSERKFAFPLEVLENNGFLPVLQRLKDIIEQKEIELIIVGFPYHVKEPDSSKSPVKDKITIQKIIEDFYNKLQAELHIPIVKVDERYSSFIAEENLKEANINSKKSKRFVDMEAARLLLEEFLKCS